MELGGAKQIPGIYNHAMIRTGRRFSDTANRRVPIYHHLMMRTFEKLDAWKACHELVLAVYRATDELPERERLLRDRMRAAALVAPAKLANGSARQDRQAFLRHVALAGGFLAEFGYVLQLAKERELIRPRTVRELDALRGRATFYAWKLYDSLTAPRT